MEINLLNPAQLATSTDPAIPGVAETVDGAVFAKMMAQIGMAPETAAVVPTADVAIAGAEPAVAALLRVASAVPDVEMPAPASPEGEALETASDTEETLTPGDLPPLLAALIAPAPQPVVPAGPALVPGAVMSSATRAISVALSADLQSATVGKDRATADLPATLAETPAAPVQAVALQALHPHFARPALSAGAAAPGEPAAIKASGSMGVEPRAAAVAQPEAMLRPAAEASLLIAPAPAMPFEAVSASASAERSLPAEPVIEHQLDLAREGEWLDRLAKDIARTAGGEANLRFRLNPEHLGSLHVELTQGASGASVRLTADTEAARTILVDAQPRLIAEARAHGVKIAEAHVDLGSQSQSSAGGGHRDGRDLPAREYLTTWKAAPGEEAPDPPRRTSSERYA